MQSTDLIYLIFLSTSLLAGFLVKQAHGDFKRLLCLLFGLIFSVFICGQDIWHALVLSGGLIIFFSLVSFSFIHYVVFLWGFCYLGFFHNVESFGFSKPSSFSKMYQIFITLRVVGVAFEVHDTHELINKLKPQKNGRQIDEVHLKLTLKYKGIITSPYDILSYVFSYIGMLTGPYYSYRTFNDYIQGWPARAPAVSLEPFYRRIQEVPFFLFAYLISSYFFSFKYITSHEFLNEGLLYRLVYIGIVFFTYRMRLYFAWTLGECVCMTAGLGAYPECSQPIAGEGPTDLESLDRWMTRMDTGVSVNYDAEDTDIFLTETEMNSVAIESNTKLYTFVAIQNVSAWKCEFSPSVRQSMKSWNMTVRYWLIKNIYQRCLGPKILRSLLTVLTLAFWFGLEPGQALSFISIPVVMMAERGIPTTVVFFGLSIPPGSASLLRWILKMRTFEYLCLGFLFPNLEEVLACWSSVGYYLHFLVFALAALQLFMFQFVTPYNIRELLEEGGEVEPGWRKLETDKWNLF